MTDVAADQSPSIAKLLPALIRARKDFPPLVKDSANPHFNSRYADLAAVLEACDGTLGKHDLAILQVPVWEGGALVLHTTLCHTSGEWVRATYPVAADLSRPQVTGAGLTYARRYTYMAVAGIAPEDDDGETASGRGHQATSVVRPAPARNGNGNGNGHANGKAQHDWAKSRQSPPVTTAPKPRPAPTATANRVPVSGSGLWRWASEIEQTRGPGLIKFLVQFGMSRDWPGKMTAWSSPQVAEAHGEAENALELIYDPPDQEASEDPDLGDDGRYD